MAFVKTGKNHYSNKVASAAIRQGFLPDVISTDLTADTAYQYSLYSLLFIMSKHLNMGISLEDVICGTTFRPAKLLGVEVERGTLLMIPWLILQS